MTTAAQVCKAALQRILVQGSEADLEPSEYQDAIFALNNMMEDWAANGTVLGYTTVADLGDDITVAAGAIDGIIDNLAIKVAPDYEGTVSPELRTSALRGRNTCRKIGAVDRYTQYPSTLPYGSGNRGYDWGWDSYRFYPGREEEILGEYTGAIGLEDETE